MRPDQPLRPTGPRGCGAKAKRSKRDDGLCEGPAVTGTDRCRMHSGKSAARAKAEGAVRADVLAWGLTDVCADPGEVLLRLVTQSAARAQRYAAELEDLVAKSPTLRDALIGDAWGEFGKQGEFVRGLARLEAEERDRCAGFATKAIAAGLAERQVRLAERQGALMVDVIRAVLADFGLADDPRVAEIVPRRVREITGSAA